METYPDPATQAAANAKPATAIDIAQVCAVLRERLRLRSEPIALKLLEVS